MSGVPNKLMKIGGTVAGRYQNLMAKAQLDFRREFNTKIYCYNDARIDDF
jgi:hypothetical protein